MDKASKALRRSSVCLKSIGGGHRNLNMVISELKEVRTTAKAFIASQNTALVELLKWATDDENQAIKHTFMHLAELNMLWTEVQKNFSDHLKEFTHQFELILEGEQHVDQAKNRMTVCENRELKIRKEIKKTAKKGTTADIQKLEEKLIQAERSKEAAQYEVLECVRENEAVKLIRVKEGLLKLSESYLELAHKCNIIFEAQKEVVSEIPDVHDQNIHEIMYTGNAASRQAVMAAKERLEGYRRSSQSRPCAPPMPPELHSPPPPYSPQQFPTHRFTGNITREHDVRWTPDCEDDLARSFRSVSSS